MEIIFSFHGRTYGVPAREPSENLDEAKRTIENIRVFGQGTLTDICHQYGMEGLMLSYKEVAKAYEVDAEDLLNWWVKDVGIWQALAEKSA